jgi:hypothetical protein
MDALGQLLRELADDAFAGREQARLAGPAGEPEQRQPRR